MTSRPALTSQKPWYLVIGPADAGKSTALQNSGLSFSDQPTTAPGLEGAAGDLSRHWEAEEAVFLECPGSLVGAASADADEAAWNGLLKSLKRRNGRRPLNGVIVAVPLDALTTQWGSETEAAMRRSRKRIAQADAALGAQLPVYVVVTKADRMPGFPSFFGALTLAERERVWGVTLPLREGLAETSGAAERLAQAIDGLRAPLSRGLLARLHDEDDPRRAVEIFGFPRAFASLTPRLRTLVEAFGGNSRLQPAPRLRGLYLTAAAPGFFLNRLFTQVIFVEEALVTIDARGGPERRRLRQIGAALAAISAIGLATFLGFAYSDQSRLLASAQDRLAAYAGAAGDLPIQDVAESDFARAARALAALPSEDSSGFHLGALSFDRSAKIEAAQRELAGRALNGLLLPRILVAVQQDMRAPGRPQAQVADDAKAYLMLGGVSALDRNFVDRTLTALYERFAPAGERAALRAKTAALLADPLTPIALDPIVVEDARALAAP